jgi:hypothetical protein
MCSMAGSTHQARPVAAKKRLHAVASAPIAIAARPEALHAPRSLQAGGWASSRCKSQAAVERPQCQPGCEDRKAQHSIAQHSKAQHSSTVPLLTAGDMGVLTCCCNPGPLPPPQPLPAPPQSCNCCFFGGGRGRMQNQNES